MTLVEVAFILLSIYQNELLEMISVTIWTHIERMQWVILTVHSTGQCIQADRQYTGSLHCQGSHRLERTCHKSYTHGQKACSAKTTINKQTYQQVIKCQLNFLL